MKKILRAIRLIPIIIKNLFLLTFDAIRRSLRGRSWLFWLAAVIILAVVVGGGIFGYRKYQRSKLVAQMTDSQVSLSQAATMGKATAHKLLVQIENTKCPVGQTSQCYQRGDIVLIMPSNHQFSLAEKTGFLILLVDLTDKQAEILTQATQKDTGKNGPDGRPILDTTARRRYAMDLSKVGISPNDQKGQEITGKTYQWSDVISQKKGN
ncbi:MAG: hypothetical protein P4L62_02605 [Candidatus Pacebacteria bacterium]|nr:hypothetical protein [Candidatus Paceibacterota bacterium]